MFKCSSTSNLCIKDKYLITTFKKGNFEAGKSTQYALLINISKLLQIPNHVQAEVFKMAEKFLPKPKLWVKLKKKIL